MANDSVVIKISGDIKNYSKALEDVQDQTKDLNETLNSTALKAGVAFGAVTAGIITAVKGFKDSIRPATELQNILKNQGIFSSKLVEEYGNIATELKKITGVDDELITSGQAVLQRFIGQTKITKELTEAVLNFAAATGVDTVTAFNLVGKTAGTSTNALSRYGIEIESSLTTQQKLEAFIANSNSKFRDQAKALNEVQGPLARISSEFGNVVENIGQKFAPVVDEVAGGLERIAVAAQQSDTSATIISAVGAGLFAVSGTAVGLSAVAKGIVAINEALIILKLGVGTLVTLAGALGVVVASVAAIYTVLKQTDAENTAKNIDDAQKILIKNNERLIELEKQKKQGLAVDPELNVVKKRIASLKEQIKTFQEVAKAKEKQEELDDKELERINKVNEQAKETKKQQEETAKLVEKEKEERKKLREELELSGKTELEKLQTIRDKRIKLAKNDKELLLLIEQDFQNQKLDLERKTSAELEEIYKARIDYEKQLREKTLSESAQSPLKALSEIGGLTGQQRLSSGLGAGAGILNAVGQGAEGARGLVVEGGALAVDAIAPGLGQALKPLLGQLTQGPEAAKQFAKEFAESVPVIIEALIEAIPVLIEELANQFPVIVERLAEKSDEIIESLVRAMPQVGIALSKSMPLVAMSLIKEMPSIATSFIEALINGADDFVKSLVDAVNPFSSENGGGGFVGDFFGSIGDIIGFSNGGQASVKKVPSGFAGDRFPAFLSSDELVVKPKVASQLERFLDRNMNNSGNMNNSALSEIAELLRAPMNVQTSVQVDNRKFADIILQLNRQNARLN